MRLICQTSALNYSVFEWQITFWNLHKSECGSARLRETKTQTWNDYSWKEHRREQNYTFTVRAHTHTHTEKRSQGEIWVSVKRDNTANVIFKMITQLRNFSAVICTQQHKKHHHHHHSFVLSLCSFNELFMTMNTQILSLQTLWVNEYSHIWFPRTSIYQLMGISAGNNDHSPCWEEGWQFVHLS